MGNILLSSKLFFVFQFKLDSKFQRSLQSHFSPLKVPFAQSKLGFFMSTTTSGLMLRHTRFVTRRTALRHASSTAEASQAASNTAAKSKEAASNATSKASDGLSRVTSSAGSAASGVAGGVSNAARKVTGRAGRLISLVQCESICCYGPGQAFSGQLSLGELLSPEDMSPNPLTILRISSPFLASRSRWLCRRNILGQGADLLLAIYPPTVYYSKVGFELAKLVFKGRQMSPP